MSLNTYIVGKYTGKSRGDQRKYLQCDIITIKMFFFLLNTVVLLLNTFGTGPDVILQGENSKQICTPISLYQYKYESGNMASKGKNVLAMYIICCREGKYLEKRKIANIFKMGYHFSYRNGKAERFRKMNQMKGKI